ncbi:myxochelin export MFS transporter MxcK [Vitiosangium sp. GDMCC 1.1324]|uniref:myxochelin export MFS transporter MxcK n=1 Tax=Vitiosangium sp. (strain GDMCC 1.1324) TaxID=2138576 RepID=UPI000D3BD844|nr:myxochelin export MFS transporter MxcK [Vitiosangium sp. GDMCC 1.1324]PTL78942.1 MFS transporter [Vitiosangium sp. GDMCC 1.1324]
MNASPSPRQERQWLWLLAGMQFTHLLDFMIVMPLGPEFMRRFGITAAQFGAMVSAYTLASAVMGVLGVFWLDRFDRKRALLLLYAGFILATLACGAAGSHTWLLVARTVAGSCAGLMGAVLLAIVGDLVPAERRGRAIGTVMSAYGLCGVAGVPMGLGLASQFGWRAPFWVICALAGGVWLCLWWTLPAVDRHLTGAREDSNRSQLVPGWTPELGLGWLLTFGVVFSGFLLIPYLSPYMVGNLGLRLVDLSWVYLFGGAASLLSSRWIGHLADRYGPARVLAALLVGTMGPHLVFTHLTASPPPVVGLVFVLFMTLTSGRAIPTMALVASRVPPALRGRYLAVNSAASDAASGLGAWVSGWMLMAAPDGALIGFGRVGWVAVGVTVFALCTLWTFGRSAVSRSAAPA